MSRSGYDDDCDNLGLYRGQVASATRGKRGQAFFKELAEEMDKMPDKVLIADELIDSYGQCCTMGVVCKSRGLDASKIDYDESWHVGRAVGIAEQLASEIAFMNDEWSPGELPQQRWIRMRKWVNEQIV